MTKKTSIGSLLSTQKGRITSAIILTVLTGVVLTSIGFVLKYLVDDVVIGNNPNLAIYILLLGLSIALWFTLDMIKRQQIVCIGNNITKKLIDESYETLLESDVNYLEKCDTTDFESKIIKSSSNIGDNFISKNVIKFICDLIVLLFIIIGMFINVPLIGLIVFLTLPIDFLIIKGFKKYELHLKNRKDSLQQEGEKTFKDTLSNIKSYKLKNSLLKEKSEFISWHESYQKAENKYYYYKGLTSGSICYVIVGLVLTAILGTGVWLYNAGNYNITVGEIIYVASYVPFVFIFFNRVLNYNLDIKAIEEDRMYLDEITSIKSEKRSETIDKLEEIHNLKFSDVGYNDKKGIELSNINFEIKRGEKLGILIFDKIDNGKVISELFTKLIRPTMGTISINSCDINKISSNYLRETITSISSNDKLFKDTIMNNIIYPYEFDEYKYNDALSKSGLRRLFSDGIIKDDYIVDDNIDSFLKQQIILASAFYKDSKIFVIDYTQMLTEPKKMEALIKEIYNLKNKIIIMITTKIFNVINCDKILIVGENGGMEYGKYSELIKNKDSMLYQSMRVIRTNKKKEVV